MQTMSDFAPLIIVELFLIFGGVLAFAWWQLRDLRKEREKKVQLQDEQLTKDK
jgi:membrane protein implicated in regulation of membrane protease activity